MIKEEIKRILDNLNEEEFPNFKKTFEDQGFFYPNKHSIDVYFDAENTNWFTKFNVVKEEQVFKVIVKGKIVEIFDNGKKEPLYKIISRHVFSEQENIEFQVKKNIKNIDEKEKRAEMNFMLKLLGIGLLMISFCFYQIFKNSTKLDEDLNEKYTKLDNKDLKSLVLKYDKEKDIITVYIPNKNLEECLITYNGPRPLYSDDSLFIYKDNLYINNSFKSIKKDKLLNRVNNCIDTLNKFQEEKIEIEKSWKKE